MSAAPLGLALAARPKARPDGARRTSLPAAMEPETVDDSQCGIKRFFLKRPSGEGTAQPGCNSSATEGSPDEITMRKTNECGHGSSDCGEQSYHASGHWPSRAHRYVTYGSKVSTPV